MLRNIYLKTLRDYRYQILGWGLGLIGLMALQVQAYYNFFKGPDRDKLIQDYKQTAESFSFFFGKVYDVDTLGGYIHFEIMIYMPVLFGILALMAGSGIMRGEEEKGWLDLLLSTPHSRQEVMFAKWAAIVTVIVIITTIEWVGLVLSAALANIELNPWTALVAHLNIILVALIFGSLALFFSQVLPTRKAAAGWTGGLLAATYMLNSMAQTFESLRWLRYISPFYYYDLSKPMSPSVGTDWGAMLLLAIVPIPILLAALVMYLKRDQNNVFQLFRVGRNPATPVTPRKIASKSFWLTNTFTYGLKISLPGILIWGLGMAAYIAIIMSAFNGMRAGMLRLLENEFYKTLGFAASPSNESLVDLTVFLFLLPLFATYVLVQVAGWTSEENNGRLELTLSAPEPRWRLMLSRFMVILTSSALTLILVGVVFAISAQLFNVPINTGNAIGAFVGLWVMCVLVAAAGFALAAFGPGRAVAIGGALIVISFVLSMLGAALKLPGWLLDLSIFHQYGKPLVDGLDWVLQFILLGLSVLFILISSWRFGQRDIAS